jgi:hypothetical protein
MVPSVVNAQAKLSPALMDAKMPAAPAGGGAWL